MTVGTEWWMFLELQRSWRRACTKAERRKSRRIYGLYTM